MLHTYTVVTVITLITISGFTHAPALMAECSPCMQKVVSSNTGPGGTNNLRCGTYCFIAQCSHLKG